MEEWIIMSFSYDALPLLSNFILYFKAQKACSKELSSEYSVQVKLPPAHPGLICWNSWDIGWNASKKNSAWGRHLTYLKRKKKKHNKNKNNNNKIHTQTINKNKNKKKKEQIKWVVGKLKWGYMKGCFRQSSVVLALSIRCKTFKQQISKLGKDPKVFPFIFHNLRQ